MTGLFDGIGSLLALFICMLLFFPLIVTLLIREIKSVKLMKTVSRYTLLFLAYIISAALTLLCIRNIHSKTGFHILLAIGVLSGIILMAIHYKKARKTPS